MLSGKPFWEGVVGGKTHNLSCYMSELYWSRQREQRKQKGYTVNTLQYWRAHRSIL